MSDSISGLRKDLSQVQGLLEGGAFLSFSDTERKTLLENAERLLRKLDGLAEGYLTVGLLGGTGVGKSSLMNGLAGAEISSSSHRRPHTDLVLIYRHEDAELPPDLRRLTLRGQGQSFWHEITHGADAVRQILLCDLPDFDSLIGEHHERVTTFLEHLDVLVWVTSPEKYADARFYRFLHQTPKARQNFSFVLNKVDLLFEGQSLDSGYDRLMKVTARFQQHLGEHGVQHPLIYAVSALEILCSRPAAPWNQFAGFRHHIFQHRNAKEVMAIKAANLDVEAQHLVAAVEKEIQSLEALHSVLRDFAQELSQERQDWKQSGDEAIPLWLEAHFKREAQVLLSDLSPLVGPGHAIATVAREYERKRYHTDERAILSGLFREDSPMSSLHLQLKRVEDRMALRLMREGLPTAHIEQLKGAIHVEQAWTDLLDRMRTFVELRVANQQTAVSRRFVLRQRLTYFLLFMLFLLAMGGEQSWSELFNHPSWSSLVALAAGTVTTIFSPVGLAALGSYIILQGFLGFRFYNRYKKSLQQRTQKFIESLKIDLGRIWEEELSSVASRLEQFSQELEAQVHALADLRHTVKKD